MKKMLLLAALLAGQAVANTPDPLLQLPRTLINVRAEPAMLEGRSALRVSDTLPPRSPENTRMVLLELPFTDGEIELDMAGEVLPTASADARGFVGLAFRAAGGERYEYFYLRPSNARADDQVRRNHTLQYAAHPGYPWEVLRKQWPERYESYADMQPGRWVHVRAVVQGGSARFHINHAEQPSLVVGDLKLGQGGGTVGLWVGPGTLAHFAGLKITPR
ncbi:LamG domain-containing protein [Massilia endophytica]|uniref:LamG domain-containing protein n=1 Tax=Massilia endophytica TaxID=2899220 RepID=UPI001E2D9E56|nr:LamG domain-containing protein [Massilia endophytica]UGQ48683.1 LamG domain-containing protein [Massilia endophytica]